MSSGITLILSSLTGLGRGQLLHLHLSGLMPASDFSLHVHGATDHTIIDNLDGLDNGADDLGGV